jgi:hypothetical protein
MSDAAPVVVFDFDLTLTRWDTADRSTWMRSLALARGSFFPPASNG